ncbi:hypothetical protein M8994_18495 [Brucella sp. 21LCYQ03]|nr:hypothetical protein [Brucella sp. 21LCYQ03]
MKKLIIAACLLSTPAFAAQPMSANRASDKAFDILQGPMYGETKAEVFSAIKEQMLLVKGINPCTEAPVKAPLWYFHVVATGYAPPNTKGDAPVLNNYLWLNSSTGEIVCQSPILKD